MREPMKAQAFCPECGSSLIVRAVDGRNRLVCPDCGRINWRNAKPCAGALVERNGKVLLVRRSIEPFLGYWDIPGGFCEVDEHPAQTAIREVVEETGLEIELTGLLGLWLDSYVAITTLNVYYLARPLTHRPQAGTDADGAAWFAPKALPRRIAFANGVQALTTWAKGSGLPLHLRGVPLELHSSQELLP
jgi:ADP-ribose pyrophosphatase YjhB (NUDIX family)